jgi:hypothetical protein
MLLILRPISCIYKQAISDLLGSSLLKTTPLQARSRSGRRRTDTQSKREDYPGPPIPGRGHNDTRQDQRSLRSNTAAKVKSLSRLLGLWGSLLGGLR